MTESKKVPLLIFFGMFLAFLAPCLVVLAETAALAALSKIEATYLAQQFFDNEIAFEGVLDGASIEGDY